MKKTYLLCMIGAFLFSCSSDDSNGGNNNNPSGSFIPTTQGSYWVYDVQSTTLSGRDSLYIAGDTVINNQTYQKFKTKEIIANGFFSNALNNNGVRQSGGKAYLSGTAGLSFSEDLPFDISVSDFIIFDENAAENTALSSVSGSFEQEIQGFTVTFNYTLSSKSKAPVSNFTSGNEQYSSVKPVEITLNLGINVTVQLEGLPIPLTYPLMNPQNVVTSTQYYAQGIGAVKSTTEINYQISEIPGIELPIPQSGSEHQEEILVDYNIE